MNWQTFAVSVITAPVTSVATTIGATYTYWNADRSLDIEMVRISLSILSGENKDTSLNGRKFALRALSRYSDIDIPKGEFEEWASTGTLPEIKVRSDEEFRKNIENLVSGSKTGVDFLIVGPAEGGGQGGSN
ncbi:MAG: hypothetical protein KDJ43_04385 [Rhizobiaceae bacterium]|nr:hypothetical protein [Rhizobiaceae bacterium]